MVTVCHPSQGLIWLGGNNQYTGGVFVWTDATPFTYTRWYAHQPDGRTPTGLPEHCLVINFMDPEMWDDDDCFDRGVPSSANTGSTTRRQVQAPFCDAAVSESTVM